MSTLRLALTDSLVGAYFRPDGHKIVQAAASSAHVPYYEQVLDAGAEAHFAAWAACPVAASAARHVAPEPARETDKAKGFPA